MSCSENESNQIKLGDNKVISFGIGKSRKYQINFKIYKRRTEMFFSVLINKPLNFTHLEQYEIFEHH